MTELAFPLRENQAPSRRHEHVEIVGETLSTSAQERLPFFIPRHQLYYWRRAWQTGEAEALREIAEGETRTFPDGNAASAWLLSDDED